MVTTYKKKTATASYVRLVKQLAGKSFKDFFEHFWWELNEEPPQINWHIPYLCDELQEVAERVMRGEKRAYDLAVNIPPGTSKSTIISQMLPAWVWIRMPNARFICASHSKDLALRDAVAMRDIVESELYQACYPHVKIRQDQNVKGMFQTSRGGYRFSVGILGRVIGRHGHFLIVDDALDPMRALSIEEVMKASNYVTGTLPTRKVQKSVAPLICVMQRMHHDDAVHAMEQTQTEEYPLRKIVLPGRESELVNPPELRKNYVNGLLDPERLGEAELEDLYKRLGEYGYAAQIQQTPKPEGGGLFKTSKITMRDARPPDSHFKRLVRGWDKAGTEGGGAFSVGALLGFGDDRTIWILHVIRGQWDANERNRYMRQTAESDGKRVEIAIEQEPGAGGKESAQASVRNLMGYRVRTIPSTNAKEARAFDLASQMAGSNVYMVAGSWNRDLIDELDYWPDTSFLDQGDALAIAYNHAVRKTRRAGGLD